MDVFSWLDDQARYHAVTESLLIALAVVVVLAAFSRNISARLGTRRGVVFFLACTLLALFAARWPTFFVRHRLNPDEAQMIAQAITALHDPIPWLGFDGNSSGPFNTYVLMLPALFGAHLGFFSARVVAVLLEFGSIAALYAAAALCFDAGIARLAVIPALVFFADSVQDDFVHYSSEHLSMFFGTTMIALLAVGRRRRYPGALVFGIGAIGGAMPFAKIQAVPFDVAIVVLVAACICGATALSRRARLVRLGLFCGGIASVPLVMLSVLAAAGSLRDFWLSYIQSGLAYILYENEPVAFVTASPEFGPYFDWLGAIAIAGAAVLLTRFNRIETAKRNAFLAALVVLAGAIDAIYAPKRASPHYLLFAVFPIAAAAAAGLGLIAWRIVAGLAGKQRGLLAALFVTLCFAAQSALIRPPYNWIGAHADFRSGAEYDPIAASIARYVRPGERLAIWGWVPEYWVFSDTLLGTRDAISVYQQTPYFNPHRAYFRDRYVRDFKRNRPQGFLDAGSESFDRNGGTRFGYEGFPELAALVKRDYVSARTWKRFRFFVRRDLASRS